MFGYENLMFVLILESIMFGMCARSNVGDAKYSHLRAFQFLNVLLCSNEMQYTFFTSNIDSRLINDSVDSSMILSASLFILLNVFKYGH